MQRTKRAVVLGLCLLLGAITYVAQPADEAEAALWCYQLRNCTGNAGCTQGGDLNGCTITCNLGGTAECDPLAAD